MPVTFLTDEDAKEYVRSVNNKKPDANGNVDVEGGSGGTGEDGFSPVATVAQTSDGATITITDKNGTTTATVTNGKNGAKGDKGDTGATGAKGDKGDTGAAGTSVTVKSVTESTEDGGENVVTFSDGKKLTVRNGRRGSDGASGGSGGGATPDWNAAEGEPGHILNRPFYKTVSTGMILENSQLFYSEDGEMLFVTDEFHLQVGNEYVVTWNGVDYTCTAFEFREDPESPAMPAVGNKYMAGLDYSEEPFFLAGLPDGFEAEEGLWGFAVDFAGATEVTVSIQEISTDMKTIPEEFLPEDALKSKYIVNFVQSKQDTGIYNPDMSFGDALSLIDSGKDVVARVMYRFDDPDKIELRLHHRTAGALYFSATPSTIDHYSLTWIRSNGYANFKTSKMYGAKAPEKGVDYFTEEDKAELVQEVVDQVGTVDIDAIVQQVLDQLGTGVIGEVDADNNILITSTLPNGTYTMRYENADGSTTVIGTFTVSGGSDPVPDPEPDPEPNIVNLADPTSADWLTNKRINSGGTLKDISDAERGNQTMIMTNKIPISGVTKLHIKGLDIMSNLVASNNNFCRYYVYLDDGTLQSWQLQPSQSAVSSFVTTASYDSSVVVVDIPSLTNYIGAAYNLTHIRLGGILTGTAEDVIITADQDIV